MLNSYYICDKQTWLNHVELFHPSLGSHYIDLPNGQILVSANFPENHSSQETFEALAGVVTLPHPVFEGAKPLDQKHVDALTITPLASKGAGITKGSTVLDVAKAAAAINPLMKLRQF